MKSYIYIIKTFIILGAFLSCSSFELEEEIPNTFEFQEQIFISGLLTNEFDFVSLELQKTVPTDNNGFNPINSAQIFLFTRETPNASAILVTDSFIINNGRYTSTKEVTPTIGNTYWVEIILEDGTTFKSEEEILKAPIPITIANNNGDIRITIEDPINEENFYLVHVEHFENNTVISDTWVILDDVNDESDLFFNIASQNEGVATKVSLFNINFSTFQFYNISLIQLENEIDIFFSPPRNLYGNITNTSTNRVVLGNFGIVGFSSAVKKK